MNKHEIKAYEQAITKYNPFHGVNFPITSVQLCEIINGLREKYNEKVVELRHDNFMVKIAEFSGLNFQVAESEYLDDQKKPRKCYLLGKRECRILAATESKTITVLLIDYLEQLELIFEKAKGVTSKVSECLPKVTSVSVSPLSLSTGSASSIPRVPSIKLPMGSTLQNIKRSILRSSIRSANG